MLNFSCRTALACVTAILLISQPALLAQGYTDTRSVQGTISDASGKPAAGAIVKIKNLRTLRIRSYVAQKDGAYAFHGLGTTTDYELKADYQGRSSDTKTLSRFDSRKQAVINLEIPAGS